MSDERVRDKVSRVKGVSKGGGKKVSFITRWGALFKVRLLYWVFIFALGVLTGNVLASRWGARPAVLNMGANAPRSMQFLGVDLGLAEQVYRILKQEYVNPDAIDETKMYYSSIKGMVHSVGDLATEFMDPEDYSNYKKALDGEYEGIGALLEEVAGNIRVVSVFEGSPAQRAGLRAGDIIIEVDGVSTVGKRLLEVVRQIRGEAGTEVSLTVVRPTDNNRRLDLRIVRAKIDAPSMRIAEEKDGIIVFRIRTFSDANIEQWRLDLLGFMSKIKQKLEEGEASGLIIDLRGNPGGYLGAAIELASYFLPSGVPVTYRDGRGGIEEVYKTRDTDNFKIPQTVPVVVLVDRGSASASEIFAGAMQYYKRAYIIGTKTFGKATVQTGKEFPDGSYLKYTVAYWTLPDKTEISQNSPIVPDKIVEFDFKAHSEEGVDNQLQAAYEYLRERLGK